MDKEDRPDISRFLAPTPWWRGFMKIKINPLYGFLLLVACLFIAIWFGGSKSPGGEIAWKRIESEWISAEVPADIVEFKEAPDGIHYLSGGDGQNIAVVTLLPAPEGSEIKTAFVEGAPRVAEVFLRLFPLEGIEDVDCRLDLPSKSYQLTGIRRRERRAVYGIIWLVSDLPNPKAVVIMTSARLSSEAKALCKRVRGSIRIKTENKEAIGEKPEEP